MSLKWFNSIGRVSYSPSYIDNDNEDHGADGDDEEANDVNQYDNIDNDDALAL